MAEDRRYRAHILVAKDGDQYSALCYEFTTVGCGPDILSALQDAINATIEYLEYLIEEGRSQEAFRPATPELLLEYLNVSSDEGMTPEQMKEALEKVILASVLLEREVEVEYNVASGETSYKLPAPCFAEMEQALINYPVEVVFAGA